ncbi:hypothetical protein GCM10027043_26520 [Ferruginibacter profundus]
MLSCNSQSTTPATKEIITKQEIQWCVSMNIDPAIFSWLRIYSDSAVKPLPKNLDNIIGMDMDIDSTLKPVPGFLFNASNTNSKQIVMNLYDELKKLGYTICTIDDHFGLDKQPDVLAILKTTDKYQVLKQLQTNGINWEIDNDSLLHLIKIFDAKYSLDLIGASGDWCEFRINREPQNWLTLAKEAYKVCPDIVDQGAETVEKLAAEMKRTKRLYFWWD